MLDKDMDNYVADVEETAYSVGITVGTRTERKRIIDLLKAEASEWLSHDGQCLCRYKGDEVLRLIRRIEESK